MADYDPDNVFGKILRDEAPCTKVYEDDVALAFMDIMPRTPGHVLVVPKLPARTLFDLPAEAIGPYMQRVQKIAATMMRAMGADGLTIQQFNEAAGGQVVFHLHVHILPRWAGAVLRAPGHMGDRAEIEENAARIRAAFL
jgi:histidine triad (HIT) family protein